MANKIKSKINCREFEDGFGEFQSKNLDGVSRQCNSTISKTTTATCKVSLSCKKKKKNAFHYLYSPCAVHQCSWRKFSIFILFAHCHHLRLCLPLIFFTVFFLLSLSLCSAEVNANGCAQLRDASISSRAARSDEGNLRMCGTPPQWCAVGRGAGGEPVRANGSARRSYPPASISRCRPPLAGWSVRRCTSRSGCTARCARGSRTRPPDVALMAPTAAAYVLE